MTTSGSMPFAYAVGDVNGDGRGDYAGPSAPGPNQPWNVWLGGLGSIAPHLQHAGPGWNSYQPAGDVDGDGCDDLVWLNQTIADNTVVSGADGSVIRTVTGPVRVIGGPDCDFDGDGYDDLLVSWGAYPAQILEVRSGRDHARLHGWVLTPGVGFFYTMFLGDLDGDGFEDVGLGHEDPPFDNLVFVSYGPDGTRGITVPYPFYEPARAGDTDVDGEDEILSAAPARIVHGTTLQTLWTVQMPTPSTTLNGSGAVGDVDGDGVVDFWIAERPGFLVSGATHAALPGQQVYQAHPLGDIDGDGRVEMLKVDLTAGSSLFEWSDPTLPVASRLVRRGAPGTTSNGRKPRIKVRGSCTIGRTVFFDVRGAMPNGTTFFVFGNAADVDLAPLGAPGNHSYTTAVTGRIIPTDPRGIARHRLAVPNTATLFGATVSAQAAVWDPPANALGVVASHAIDLEVHN
jgi:hypothetical protein